MHDELKNMTDEEFYREMMDRRESNAKSYERIYAQMREEADARRAAAAARAQPPAPDPTDTITLPRNQLTEMLWRHFYPPADPAAADEPEVPNEEL